MTAPENTDAISLSATLSLAWRVPRRGLELCWARLAVWKLKAMSRLQRMRVVPRLDPRATPPWRIASFLGWAGLCILIFAVVLTLQLIQLAAMIILMLLGYAAGVIALPFLFVFWCGRALYR